MVPHCLTILFFLLSFYRSAASVGLSFAYGFNSCIMAPMGYRTIAAAKEQRNFACAPPLIIRTDFALKTHGSHFNFEKFGFYIL